MNISDYLETKNLEGYATPYGRRHSNKDINFNELLGKVINKITILQDKEAIAFELDDCVILMHHWGDCCESVTINDITGDLDDLIGYPLLLAEESTNSEDNPPEYADSFTWTFYKLATFKGYVDIRWLGESNGYYSESVDITKYIKST